MLLWEKLKNQLHGNEVSSLRRRLGVNFPRLFVLLDVFWDFLVRELIFFLTSGIITSVQKRSSRDQSLSVDAQPSWSQEAATQTKIIQTPTGRLLAFCSHEQHQTSEQKRRQHKLKDQACPPYLGLDSSACAKRMLSFERFRLSERQWQSNVVPLWLTIQTDFLSFFFFFFTFCNFKTR